ncbi:MAG: leucyl/phenylalanyl-tRNA--protein transferase [Caldilineaceae bacterium]
MHLTPQLLLAAYSQGVFPMGHDDGEIYWYDPDPRAILPLDTFHVPRSLKQCIQRGGFTVRLNTAFRAVMLACAAPAPGREHTWITPEIVDTYCVLHEYGYAHSIETWIDGRLVGGLYGVALGGLFAGESMFSHVTDASKIALVYLVDCLRTKGFVLHDTQFMTKHLRRFGAIEIPREEYHQRLAQALAVPAQLA